jgi:hypothetical protein
MTAYDLDDRSFLTDGRPFLNSRQSAVYCGFEPRPGLSPREDQQMRRFYAWASSRGLHRQPGRAVYRRADLDAAIANQQPTSPAIERMRRLARQDVADRQRIALQVRRPIKA